jgi:MoxR-like ATPase
MWDARHFCDHPEYTQTQTVLCPFLSFALDRFKMLSIGLRLRYKMPVVIMGETGCGKSSLMRSMCTILSWRLYTLNIHGGMTDGDIIAWMQVRRHA